MPYYAKLGQLPPTRHIHLHRPDGALYYEEVFGPEGFVGPTSTLYHIHPPTQVTGSLRNVDRHGPQPFAHSSLGGAREVDPETSRHGRAGLPCQQDNVAGHRPLQLGRPFPPGYLKMAFYGRNGESPVPVVAAD